MPHPNYSDPINSTVHVEVNGESIFNNNRTKRFGNLMDEQLAKAFEDAISRCKGRAVDLIEYLNQYNHI